MLGNSCNCWDPMFSKKLDRPVQDNITKIRETVCSTKAVLLDVEKQRSKKNELVIEWLRRLKVVFYEADDILDDLSTELIKQEMMTSN
ncbi:hypothetical protein Patl1_05330 [Pistacia atlantica]|uniref:Uncharacterized protein n=1 Tax=Pistacia atlantica TaxID=434234 RepID=A0ACC1BWC2_9ROSI|nr:hypothetical protein Patl1_05330 [Pistacia atlantica]